MARKTLLFIYNPTAGKGVLKPKLSEVIEEFMKAKYEVTIYATQREHEATELVASKSENYDRIVCSGGDGTMHEVMEGLMQLPKEKRRPCGYIPAGTVNDFANSLVLPGKVEEDARVAVSEHISTYDIGSMNGNYFNYIAAFGAFTSVSYETPQSFKNVMGKAAYFLEGLIQLPSIQPYHLIIRGDNGIEIEDDFIFGMVTNARSVGGFPVFNKTALKLNDGVFEGVFVRNPKNPMELQSVVNAFLTKNTNEQIVAFRSSCFEILCEQEVSYTLDGEDGGNFKEVVIENHKAAVSYANADKKHSRKTKGKQVKKE